VVALTERIRACLLSPSRQDRTGPRGFLDINTFARNNGWLHVPLQVYADDGIALCTVLLVGWWTARARATTAGAVTAGLLITNRRLGLISLLAAFLMASPGSISAPTTPRRPGRTRARSPDRCRWLRPAPPPLAAVIHRLTSTRLRHLLTTAPLQSPGRAPAN
jgi:hypothetical protein